MKSRWLAAGVAVLLVSPATWAQEKKSPGAPSEMHYRMAKRAGEHETVSKLTLPDGKAVETKGTAKITAVLGGRFLQEEGTGTLLGNPVSTLKLVGYNDAAGQFEAVWLYTGSTAMMTMTGKAKDDNKTVEFSASVPGPKDAKMNFTIVYRFADADRFIVELTARSEDGSKGPTMETTYTRKK